MHFLPASRTKRRLLKVASLGLAGLIAGLLSGCNQSANAASARTRPSPLSSDSASPEAIPGSESNPLPKSIEATQIPALRHPPSSRSLQYGTVRPVSISAGSYGRNGS
jgi:hypothetical protein